MDDNTLGQLIADAGPLDDLFLEIVELTEGSSSWAVRLKHMDIRIQNFPDLHNVGFSVVFDGPAEANAGSAFKALLAANVLWRENGGLRFALGSQDNLIELSIEMAAVDVTPGKVALYCRGLAEHAATWALIFQGRVQASDEADMEYQFNPNFIRM